MFNFVFPEMFQELPPEYYMEGTPPPRLPGPPQPPPRTENYIPPASALAQARLPQVIVTKEDLLDDTNCECAICLQEQNMSTKATKLPCGHLFCHTCINDWLRRNCSCPTCRFELPTTDAEFEAKRRKRHQRKAQYRIGELMSLSVKELRNVLALHKVPLHGACEKKDIVDALMASHDVVILPEHDAAVYQIEELEAMSREQIVNLFKTLRLITPSDSEPIEQILASLLECGRIKVDYTRENDVSAPANKPVANEEEWHEAEDAGSPNGLSIAEKTKEEGTAGIPMQESDFRCASEEWLGPREMCECTEWSDAAETGLGNDEPSDQVFDSATESTKCGGT